MNFWQLTLAMAPAPGAEGAPQQSPYFMFIWIGVMIAIFYVIAIRPQQRREKEKQALIAAVKTGDRVLFAGGILGVVANAKERTLIVKIADNTKVEILRAAVARVLAKGEDLGTETT